MLSVEFVSNSGNVGAFDKHWGVSGGKRKKWQCFPWMGRFNCARRRRAVAEMSFYGEQVRDDGRVKGQATRGRGGLLSMEWLNS